MFLTVKNMDILSTLFTLKYCFVLFTEIKLNRYGLPKFNILSHKVLTTTFKYLDHINCHVINDKTFFACSPRTNDKNSL